MATDFVRSRVPIGLLASLVLAGCAARQKSVVVLLPEEGNASAAVKVTNQRGSQVLSVPYQATEIAGPTKAPAAPVTLDQTTVERLFGEALSAMPSVPVRFDLYFESDSTDLTAESRDLLPQILAAIAERRPAAVGVVATRIPGPADRTYRLSLSGRGGGRPGVLGVIRLTRHRFPRRGGPSRADRGRGPGAAKPARRGDGPMNARLRSAR
jgi:hypothetical protein